MRIILRDINEDKHKSLRRFIQAHSSPLAHKVHNRALVGVYDTIMIRNTIKFKLEQFEHEPNHKKSVLLWRNHLELLDEVDTKNNKEKIKRKYR